MKLWYPQAASNTQIVGATIAEVANEALEMGTNPKDLWCVGHSLGSHVCGHAGRRTNQPMGRITGELNSNFIIGDIENLYHKINYLRIFIL